MIAWCRCDEAEGDNPGCGYHPPADASRKWGCSKCGYYEFDGPNEVCSECKPPEAA